MPGASQVRPPIDGENFQVVVIGGGINGVAIARECALAGARTLLLEQNDFASGTTSRATRIIHGGLRYLETGEIGLVRQSLRERERLLRDRPHLVRPLQFVLALPQAGHRGILRSSLGVRAGLWLYARMGHYDKAPSSSIHEVERFLDAGSRLALYSYDDAQCEFPERLVAEWLVEAADAGAVARNHTQVLQVERNAGRVTGVRARDLLTDHEFAVTTQWIVNATGPWADKVLSESGVQPNKPLIGGVRGSHIVLPEIPNAPRTAIYTEAADGRPVFCIPWNGMLMVGTTEIPDSGDPAAVRPDTAEIDYLLGAFNRLFPGQSATHADVVYAYAGVRPLPHVEELQPSAITRRHFLYEHEFEGAAGMLSIVGGKLTTAGSLARECARAMKLPADQVANTIVPAPCADGIASTMRHWSDQVAMLAGIPAATASAVAEWHGRSALCIVRMAQRDHHMRLPLCPHSVHVVAEAIYAFSNEYACNAADVLLRRVPVALNACWSSQCARTAIQRIGTVMNWSVTRQEQEFELLENERNGFLTRPGPHGAHRGVPQTAA